MNIVRPLVGCAASVVVIAFGCTSTDPPNAAGAATEAVVAANALTPTEQVVAACKGQFKNRGQCVSCVAHAVNVLRDQGVISGAEGGAIVSSFAQGGCQNACIPTTCAVEGPICGNVSDLCGGTLTCTCPSGESCVGGTCQAGCSPLSTSNGPDLVICSCPTGPVQDVAPCGTCADAQNTCNTACGACGSSGTLFTCIPNFGNLCPALNRQCTVPLEPPALGPDLVQCGCRADTVSVNACGSCDDVPGTCAVVCATCGGGGNLGGSGCIERNASSCPAP